MSEGTATVLASTLEIILTHLTVFCFLNGSANSSRVTWFFKELDLTVTTLHMSTVSQNHNLRIQFRSISGDGIRLPTKSHGVGIWAWNGVVRTLRNAHGPRSRSRKVNYRLNSTEQRKKHTNYNKGNQGLLPEPISNCVTRGLVNWFIVRHWDEIIQTQSNSQEEQRLHGVRVFLERTMQNLKEYVQEYTVELVFNFSEVGIWAEQIVNQGKLLSRRPCVARQDIMGYLGMWNTFCDNLFLYCWKISSLSYHHIP
jgi:hypothetical protein